MLDKKGKKNLTKQILTHLQKQQQQKTEKNLIVSNQINYYYLCRQNNLQKMLLPTNLLILNVQFCKSCPTHSWCTHHDEQKYLSTYKKLKHFLQQQFGHHILVQGNVIPDELVPIKPAQNKYFSTKNNKYVTFPSIGAFELALGSELIFSKKKTNTWPNFADIAQIIHLKLHGQPRSKSPSRKHNNMKNVNEKNLPTDVDIKTQKDNLSLNNQQFLDQYDKRSTFYKNRQPKEHQNFTLTDHFKNYHNGNYKTTFNNSKHPSYQYFTTAYTDNENMSSEISSFRNGNCSEKEFLEFKKSFDAFGLEGKLPEFFKKKAFMKLNSGKKEMIIKLDSIEEQSVLMDDNNPNYGQNINLTNTHTTFKSKSKDNHKKLMKRFTEDFEELQAKFKHFQKRVQTIRQENKKFDQRDSSGKLNDRIIKEINDLKKKQKRLRSSEIKEAAQDEGQDDETIENPIIFARKKLKNIEDYINGTEQQKNEKLKKIYGEWKLLKKSYKGKNYVSPYKLQVTKRTGNIQNNKSKNENEKNFSSSCSSSEQLVIKQKPKSKVLKHKLPKMTGVKYSKSNQILPQHKFYSTARENFHELGSPKFNDKMSEKKFDSFSNNSADNQFHSASAAVKPNTFDSITLGQKFSSEINPDWKIQPDPQYLNQKNQNHLEKGKNLKMMPTKKGKGQFLTKQKSSRQITSSSRKIHKNQMADKQSNEDQRLENDAQMYTKGNQKSKKVKNAVKIKNVAINNSKSLQKSLLGKDKQRNFEDSSQQNQNLSNQFLQVFSLDQAQKSQQISPSLQDNFFASIQAKPGTVDKNMNSKKIIAERFIRLTKEQKTVDGQMSKKKTSKKKARKIVAQNQITGEKRKRTESFGEDENYNQNEQESLKQLAYQNFAQTSSRYENLVITKNQHKLQKKSKVQKESQASKAKKLARVISKKEFNQKSENQGDQEIYNDSEELSEKINNIEKRKQKTKVNRQNKCNIDSDQTIKLDKVNYQKQTKTKKTKTAIKAESEFQSDSSNRQDGEKDMESDFVEISQKQEEKSENLSQIQSQCDPDGQSQKVENNFFSNNQRQDQMYTAKKGLKNEDEKNEQSQKSQLQRGSQQRINNDKTDFNETKNQFTQKKVIVMNKQLGIARRQKKKEVKTNQTSIESQNKQSIAHNSNHNEKMSDNPDQKDTQSIIQGCRSDQVEQKNKYKSSSIKNDGQYGKEYASLDQEKNQYQCSNDENQANVSQLFQENEKNDQNSQYVKTKQKKTHKKQRNRNKQPKVNKVSVREQSNHIKKIRKTISNQSISSKKQAQEYQYNIENLTYNFQSQNNLTCQESQDPLLITDQNKIELHQQDYVPSKRYDGINRTTTKQSIKNTKAASNNNQRKQENLNPNKKSLIEFETVNDCFDQQKKQSQNSQKKLSQNSQNSRVQQKQSKQCLKQKSLQSFLNQNQTVVNKLQLKSQQLKIEKPIENTNIQKTNASNKVKYQDEGKLTQVVSVHPRQKQQEKSCNIAIQSKQNDIEVICDQREKTNLKDAVQTFNQKMLKNSNNNQNPITKNRTPQLNTEQSLIDTARSTRNKIINIYQTEREKDLQEWSDEEQLEVSKNRESDKLRIQTDCVNAIAIMNSIQKDENEENSKDVGIQNDNLQIDVGNSSRKKYEDNLSKKRDRQTQIYKNQIVQIFIGQRQLQDQIFEGKTTDQRTDGKQGSNEVSLKDKSNFQNKAENHNEKQQKIQYSKKSYPQKQETIIDIPRDTSVNQFTKKSMLVQSKPYTQDDQPQTQTNQIPHKNQAKYPQEGFAEKKVIRAPITKQFYGPSFSSQLQTYPNRQNIASGSAIYQLPFKSHMSRFPASLKSKNWVLFNKKSIEVQKICFNHSLPSLIKCVKILAEINEFLVVRLFQDPFLTIIEQALENHVFGVWLCINNQWRCVLVDLQQVLLCQDIQNFYYSNHLNNQLWPIVLQKALARGLGSYSKLSSTPCYKIFSILTGSNSLFFNIKQDPTKNDRILRYISDCENKNFVIHAEKVCKNLEQLQNKEKQARIYYVLSQRSVNQSDTLLQIRDSTKPEPKWIKLSKFVQEFKSIQILQLRINHNFSFITLPKPASTQNMTIVSLEFYRESFGSITLSTEPSSLGSLRTFLYKEEKSNYLKLVGQAKEKNKATLFFDCCFAQGKYWLFVESGIEAKVTYLGENEPKLQIVEQVKGDGLKNDWTEYLPVKMQQNSKSRTHKQNFGSRETLKMLNRLNMGKFTETGMSLKSHDDKISRLRQNFIDYLLKDKQEKQFISDRLLNTNT